MGDFTFNGVTASSMGLTVEYVPDMAINRKRMTTHVVPGRNGVLHQWDGSFEPTVRRYVCWFKHTPVATQAHTIAQWLQGAPVDARLEDDYDPAFFRKATYTGPADVQNCLERYGRITVEFEVGVAWLKAGEEIFETDVPYGERGQVELVNPAPFDSHPLIRLVGSVSGLLIVNGQPLVVRFPGTEDHTIFIDCELQECWEIVDGAEVYSNTYIGSDGSIYPSLHPGLNLVVITGGLTHISITPRWWTV